MSDLRCQLKPRIPIAVTCPQRPSQPALAHARARVHACLRLPKCQRLLLTASYLFFAAALMRGSTFAMKPGSSVREPGPERMP